MKRANNLIPAIAELENLHLAFWHAKKGKACSAEVLSFSEKLEYHLARLRSQIIGGCVDVGPYRYFKIYDPKERMISASAFGEQVLHHAVMNICHPHFEKVQIADSFACRPGKGVHASLRRGKSFCKKGNWFLKLDVRKYFDSIHHDTLKAQLQRMFKDRRLLAIFQSIIESYHTVSGRGLPIGNLTSQYFANHYLAGLDHFIKEDLRCRRYVRYMDDLVLWHEDKSWLIEAREQIRKYLDSRLQLSLKPEELNRCEKGLPFCGYIIFPHHIRLSQRSKQRYQRKLQHVDHRYHSGEWDAATCQRHVLPLIAFTRHADAAVFRRNCLSRLEMTCQ